MVTIALSAQDNAIHALSDELRSDMKSGSEPGFSIAIVTGEHSSSTLSFGLANMEWQEPNDEETLFHCASIAKHITAIAVLMLRDQGDLRLDQPIKDFLGEFRYLSDTISIRHLLSHTSGIRDQWPLLEWAGWRGNDTITTQDVLELLKLQKGSNFEPGDAFLYCNSGYTLLALLVSIIANEPFSQFVERRIFEPLGMKTSRIAKLPTEIVRRRAEGYSRTVNSDGSSIIERFSPSLFVEGSTSFLTCADEFLVWMKACTSNTIWAKYVQEMAKPQIISNGQQIPYGFGLFISNVDENKIAFHTGGDFGFSAYFGLSQSTKSALAVFANGPIANLRTICNRYLAGIHKDEKEVTISVPMGRTIPGGLEVIQSWKRRAGYYRNDLGDLLRLTVTDVQVSIERGQLVVLIPENKNEARTSDGDQYWFDNEGEGNDCLYSSTLFGEEVWHRIGSGQSSASVDPSTFRGTYYSPETQSIISVDFAGQDPVIRFPKTTPVRFENVVGNLFWSRSMWIEMHGGQDCPPTILVSTQRCFGVKFLLQPNASH